MKDDLIKKLFDAANKIHEASMNSRGSYIVVGNKTAEMLNNIDKPKKVRELRKKKIERIFNENSTDN